MPCYRPLNAWRKSGGGVTFKLSEGFVDRPLTFACGQCIGCRKERARQWAVRCVHEASLYKDNCFLTLTYDDVHLAGNGSLNKRDIQLFIKRLRKAFGANIRFLQCGEYGEKYSRPHHHVLLFNHKFPDAELFSSVYGRKLCVSAKLAKLWPYGFSTIGELTYESAAYVAGYVLKKVTGKLAEFHYDGLLPEFITMSRRPGIAHDWFEVHKDNIYPMDKVYIKAGKVARPTRYCDRLFDIYKKEDFSKVKAKRKLAARKEEFNCRRFADRELHARLLMKQRIRIYESGDYVDSRSNVCV